MTDQEFFDLLEKWEATPECQEYYNYCDNHYDTQSDEETIECAKLMIKAFGNDLGKQLILDKRFQRILSGDTTFGLSFDGL